jgi:GTP pyrophosphokinase
LGSDVVCLFISDIQKIGRLIDNAFDVLEQDNKIDGGDVSSFGYMSFHFIAKMKESYSGPRYKDIRDQVFEIQVRTIAMDAWAATSHYLDYKNEIDVPSDLRRDFYALSGLFYVADRHFEMFFNSKKAAIAEFTETIEKKAPNWDQELNLDSLTAYLTTSFPDRKKPSGSDVSALLDDLNQAGISNIKEVKAIVDKNFQWFEVREKSNPPSGSSRKSGKERRFAAVGVVRIILNERPDKIAKTD